MSFSANDTKYLITKTFVSGILAGITIEEVITYKPTKLKIRGAIGGSDYDITNVIELTDAWEAR